MNPVFIDFHIHTSNDPDNLDESYDLDALKSGIEKIADGSEYLISITDHNTINKPVYLKARKKFKNLLLGVELHIRNFKPAKPYHCHIIFDLEEINEKNIDDINKILDDLYIVKKVSSDDSSIPSVWDVTNRFQNYDFILLPHAGQNHSTYNQSIIKGGSVDTSLLRSTYYNLFDGFTARSNKGLEKTHEYFEKLGIKEFINLVTASDNYTPSKYPSCKAGNDADDFVPTWMLAMPTFGGLRLSLSEISRLHYGKKPDLWAEWIKDVSLKNQKIDIDIKLMPGLNVIIGGSSSGKSLLADSINRKIINDFEGSKYTKQYEVQNINVNNHTGQKPYYFDQSFISKICDPNSPEYSLGKVSILKRMFPSDSNQSQEIANALSELTTELEKLFSSVSKIESTYESIQSIASIARLIIIDEIQDNPLKYILPDDEIIETIDYKSGEHAKNIKSLNEIDKFLSNNPLIKHNKNLIIQIKDELELALKLSLQESLIRKIITDFKDAIDKDQESTGSDPGALSTRRRSLADF